MKKLKNTQNQLMQYMQSLALYKIQVFFILNYQTNNSNLKTCEKKF